MTTLACLVAFVGASACWGVIGFVLGRKQGRNLERKWFKQEILTDANLPKDCDLIGVTYELVYRPSNVSDPDAALDAEIEGSK